MIVFPQTSHWEEKGSLSDTNKLAEERRGIKSIFRAVLWFACRVVATFPVLPRDVGSEHQCSPKWKQAIPQDQYGITDCIFQTLNFHFGETPTGVTGRVRILEAKMTFSHILNGKCSRELSV